MENSQNQTPELNLKNSSEFKRSVWWKIYFFFITILSGIGMLSFFSDPKVGIAEFLFLPIWLVATVGFFGFVFIKPVYKPKFWLQLLIVYIAYTIIYYFITEIDQRMGMDEMEFYIDGADETNERLELIKGGGGALTREKIVAAAAKQFLCIVDQSKQVRLLGEFPLPVEVIPMARSLVGRELVKLGGDPVYREGFITDNGNQILDVYNLKILEPKKLEAQINNITGVVTNGLFALRPADCLFVSTASGIETHKALS